jgi:hypothetical protein
MKKDLKELKLIKGTGNDQPSKSVTPGTLYVICLNKPLIELWALSDRYTNDYYDNTLRYRASVYTRSNSSLPADDRIPVLLSPDDEMMLYNEELSDYY